MSLVSNSSGICNAKGVKLFTGDAKRSNTRQELQRRDHTEERQETACKAAKIEMGF